MNRLSLQDRTKIINCLVEGNSIRSTERMTETHRDTIMRLLVKVGDGCAKLLDESMVNLKCERLQIDEIWTYVGKKQAQVAPWEDKSRVGDQYACRQQWLREWKTACGQCRNWWNAVPANGGNYEQNN